MKLFKEYPATHSMSTAWYCVDEDGNVGIFDIDDDGPVPVNDYKQNEVNEVFWEDFSSEGEDIIKSLNLSEEQVKPMLAEPYDERGVWEQDKYGCGNPAWMEVIIKIDMSKYDVLLQAASLEKDHYYHPKCISMNQGLFYVDFFFNKKGVELLEDNHVILAKYKAPYYETPFYDSEPDEIKHIERNIQKFPLFIYHQDYCPNYEPATRLTNPKYPLRIEQLPKNIQETIKKLPLKFKEHDRIQLAELLPVEGIWSPRYVYNNRIWWQLASSKEGKIYYNVSTRTIIQGEKMDSLLAEGKAEEWDYHKHKDVSY